MKRPIERAIVWLSWGRAHITEAIESARSAKILNADRLLITDEVSANQARESGAFTSILPTRLLHANFLEKSRLIDLVPASYESFLYLDSDTKIISDVSLGFDMAERHGIALAPAPNYNLPEFFNFSRFMTQAGLQPADQMLYNAGVIFFHLTPRVREVLERWRDLCHTAGVGVLTDDQPFLTMAFEQLEFLPYVLSPLYNYRSLGEHAVGNIRLWHSHHPVPPDLNVFVNAWPPRRFVAGVQVSADHDTSAGEVAPLSRKMVRQNFDGWRSSPFSISIAQRALALQEQRRSREATEYLIGHLGIETSDDLSESYFAENLSYNLALCYAHISEPVKMAEQISLSHTMPGHDDDLMFHDHIDASRILNDRRERAIRREMPTLLFSCMPRSAGATITQILEKVLGMPIFHASLGSFPDLFLAPSWLDMLLEGGAITHDHFGANAFNTGVLTARGPRDLFVLVRDPRAAARSQVHFKSRNPIETPGLVESAIEHECVSNFIPWLQGWIDCARNPNTPFRVHFITYPEVCTDRAAVVRKVVRILQAAYPALSPYVDCEFIPEIKHHFVTGDDNAWRGEVGAQTRKNLWVACTDDIRSLLALEP
jgi:hypothetical protein